MINPWFCYGCGEGLAPKEHYCDGCLEKIKKAQDRFEKNYGHAVIETVQFSDGYKASKGRIDEINRSVHIPMPDGSYRVGRRMENGKIREHKGPDYRP